MNTNKIEKEISDQIIIWVKDNPKATQTEIKNKITQEITNRNYLKEDWQIHYAKERILILINKELGNIKIQNKLYNGRLGRLNFFLANLFIIGIYFIIFLLSYLPDDLFMIFFFVLTIFLIILIYPMICIHIRRLHDIGLSGWWLILGYIPVIFLFHLLFLFLIKGTNRTNKYGDKPKRNIGFIKALFNR